ncbi:DUF3649 domain-containing protein [Parahaliea mediterranea]|uniref:DUF3649 domain-containing protein n=1 Tax=Parahaliea mediterranea TaxID=651086 RepID=A0A939DDD4_9GAMM|nr:DUF3649 domain-containing protein [Parahaliea mediterranea]MBN7796123.1 DUF3649 domain-containing protein [Parahaliea mediterranea]
MRHSQPAFHYRRQVAMRVVAAALGGYTLTSAATVLAALVWPLPRAEAVAAATMLSFALYTAVIVWVFAVRRLRTAWWGLAVATATCASLGYLLSPGAAT